MLGAWWEAADARVGVKGCMSATAGTSQLGQDKDPSSNGDLVRDRDTQAWLKPKSTVPSN